jgi:hypothetical protein
MEEVEPPMKRFLIACSLSLALIATSNQKASAWKKWNFNVGLNLSHEAAENNLLWGLYRNGPHPFAQQGAQGGYGQGGYGQGGPGYGVPGAYGQAGFDPSGGYGMPGYNQMPSATGAAPATLPAPVQSTPVQSLPSGNSQTSPVSYNVPQQAGYNYNWPTSNYYAPYYWYKD